MPEQSESAMDAPQEPAGHSQAFRSDDPAVVRGPADQLLFGLEQALERMQLGFTIADVNGTILYTNPADARMHGFRAEEILGENISIFAPPANRKPLTYQKLDELQSWERVTVNVRKDGTVFPVRLQSNVMRDAAGKAIAVVTSCDDITERKRIETGIREVEAQLRQARKMEAVGRLTGGIAHDFNNILTVIMANAELISTSLENGTAEEHPELQELTNVALRGRAMIKRLMGICRQAKLAPEPLDPARVVSELMPSIFSLLPEDVEGRHSIDESLPNIHADRGALEQILLNLVTNARDAMETCGVLQVEARLVALDDAFCQSRGWGHVGEYVCISVSDTGAGMDETTKDRIFDPFFTTKPVGKGTGLGMSVVYGFMKQMQGFVDVESEVGKGTTVMLYFPLAAEPMKSESVAPKKTELPTGTETILVVEDETPIRRVAVRVLERSGYNVIAAADGEEGLDIYKQRKSEIELVITDVMMPKMSGTQMYRLIRQENKDVKFIFTSGYAAQDLRTGVAMDPTIPYLIKPWTLSEFLLQVRDVLDGSQVLAI
jgi:two-component system cell cycle sensor histidine kinase/response regulator CckA